MNCIILHGCPDDEERLLPAEKRSYYKHWMPWVARELRKRGIQTITPLMPNPFEPDYNAFAEEFAKFNVNEDTVIIGHSCGCAFLVRWLGETKRRIKKLILVAPWKIPEPNSKCKVKFYTYSIDPTIRNRVESVIIFTSDNEEDDGKKSVKIFHQVLGGKVINLKGRGHYTLESMDEEFQELIEEVFR